MATNLLIGYPHIPLVGTLGTPTTQATGYDAKNTIFGPRSAHFKTSTSVTQSVLPFNNTGLLTPDFYLLTRADLLKKSDSSDPALRLEWGDDSTFASAGAINTALTTAQLVGPNSEDFIAFPLSWGGSPPSKEFWRLRVNTTASFQHEFSKFAAGNAFDLGRDPIFPRKMQRFPLVNASRVTSYRFDFEWRGVTNTKRASFDATIDQYRDVIPVYLITRTYHDVLNEHKVIQVYIRSVEWRPRTRGLNDLTIEFEEEI